MYEERSVCVFRTILPTAWMALPFTLSRSALDVSLSWCPSCHKEAYKRGSSCYECSVLEDGGKQVPKLGDTLTAFCPTVLGSLWKHSMQEKIICFQILPLGMLIPQNTLQQLGLLMFIALNNNGGITWKLKTCWRQIWTYKMKVWAASLHDLNWHDILKSLLKMSPSAH